MATDVLDLIKADRVTAEQRRDQNRRDFPRCAAFIDSLREFSPRVIWWSEGGRVIGRRPESERRVS